MTWSEMVPKMVEMARVDNFVAVGGGCKLYHSIEAIIVKSRRDMIWRDWATHSGLINEYISNFGAQHRYGEQVEPGLKSDGRQF